MRMQQRLLNLWQRLAAQVGTLVLSAIMGLIVWLIAINSMPDHTHMFIGLKPDTALSDLVRDVKANSSRFVNEKRWVKGRFNWQEGFGAFSYSHSELDSVVKYIQNQEKHHSKKTFREEYDAMLKAFQIEYNEKYVFEQITD